MQCSVECQLLFSLHTSKNQVPPPAAGCFTRECVLLWRRAPLRSGESPPTLHHQGKLQTTAKTRVSPVNSTHFTALVAYTRALVQYYSMIFTLWIRLGRFYPVYQNTVVSNCRLSWPEGKRMKAGDDFQCKSMFKCTGMWESASTAFKMFWGSGDNKKSGFEKCFWVLIPMIQLKMNQWDF